MQTISLIILLLVFVFFIFRPIPIGFTAIAGALLMCLFGIISISEMFLSFKNDAVLLLLGIFIVSGALNETGTIDIIAEKVLFKFVKTNKEKYVLAIILIVVVTVSGFVSNTATIAIFFPLVDSIAKLKNGIISKKNTYMAIGIASLIGGNLTLSGSTPQLVVQGILSQTEGCTTLKYFELSAGTIPLILIMILYYLTIGYRLQNKTFNFNEKANKNIENQNGTKKINNKNIICIFIMLGCIAGFISNIFSLGIVSIIGALICIITNTIPIKNITKVVDWQVILVLAGSLTISKGLVASGLLDIITEYIVKLIDFNISPFVILAVVLLITIIISNMIPSTATVGVMAPMAIAIALKLNSNPLTFAISTIIGSSLCFTTPIGSPPVTMSLIGGYRFSDYIIVGGLFNIIAYFTVLLTLPLIYGI